MKRPGHQQGFTLGEIMVALTIAMLLLAAIFTATVSLNRAYAAVDNYFASHMQQIRILDFLARDVKRSFSVTVSQDLLTVTCVMPDYTVGASDPDGVADSSLVGTRRKPLVGGTTYKPVVDYGGPRLISDGKTISGSPTLTSSTGLANFTAADVGRPITGANIPAGTTILSRTSSTVVTMSRSATATTSGIGVMQFTIYGFGVRTLLDAATTSGSRALTSTTAYFTASDVGKPVVGTTIPAGTTIASVTNATTAVMSASASATGTKIAATVGGTLVVYALNAQQITRTENGQVTAIASSTYAILPQTTDWQSTNTEYTTTTVTFLPIFTSGGSAAQRSGTTVHATAYLRNKRRGN